MRLADRTVRPAKATEEIMRKGPFGIGAGGWLLIAVLLMFLALAVWFGISGWRTAGDAASEVSGMGYAAMALGIVATLGLEIGLMVLVYRSERR